MTGAKALIKGLEKQGVKIIFGYPGGAILPIYQELRDSSIHHILTRTEQGAAHAASGYSRVSGQVGVCFATSGPGATNLVTGLATAYMDSIPLVAITGQVSTTMIGTDAFQEVDTTGITQPITKHNYLVTNAEDIPRILDEAFYLASTGRPGPVLIDIPKNVAESPCSGKAPDQVDLPGYKPTYKGHATQIKLATQALIGASKPLIYAGGGVITSRAWDEVTKLAEIVGAPVVTTLMGKGAIAEKHPLFLGMLGLHGFPAANLAIMECDLLLAVGVRFDDRVTGEVSKFAPKARIIHIDIDPAEIGKNVKINIPIVGDIKNVLTAIIKNAPQAKSEQWLAEIEQLKDRNLAVHSRKEAEHLTSWLILSRLSDLAPLNTVITTDVGQHQMAAAQYYQNLRPGSFITSGGLGTMGYGLPAAMGAQMAAPRDLVVCITGDGSFQMNFNELATIREQKLPIKILLFNNQCLGMVWQLQDVYCDKKYFAVDMPGNPDFLLLAAAYGMEAYRIESPDDVDATLEKALHNGKATLIECLIRKEDLVLPMVKAGLGLNEMVMP